MPLYFNADEVFEIALQIERNGSIFYRKAAEAARPKEVRDLLMSLAEMEDGHEAAFAAMRRNLTQAGAPSEDDYSEEAGQYLKALADSQVFKMAKRDPGRDLTGRESDEEVLDIAIQLEKDSVIFYLAMKAVVPERMGRADVERIVDEEMTHIGQLSRRLAELRQAKA